MLKRFLPRSLSVQMLVVLGSALLVAQLVNFALILNESQKLSLAQIEGPAITRFAHVASDLETAAPEFHEAVLEDSSRRGARFWQQNISDIPQDQRNETLENRLTQALRIQGLTPLAVEAGFVANSGRQWGRRDNDFSRNRHRNADTLSSETTRTDSALEPSTNERSNPRSSDSARHTTWRNPSIQWLSLALKQSDGTWLVARMPLPPRDQWLGARLAAATLLVYIIVLGASAWAALRIARPLRTLTAAADAFGGKTKFQDVEPSGPEDLRNAIEAFNAMNRRVLALLDEKDRMLGALGHDLRTPLASLRIRLEGMEPEEEREAAIQKITELTEMMEEILVLARSGRAREAAKKMDVAALVEMLVDDQQELGRPVEMGEHQRAVAEVQPALLRRAITNLIDNAVKYGGNTSVSALPHKDGVEIRVTDEGPGLPPEALERVFDAFYREEGSRNRATGGTGLGLAIARSIAESHGGHVHLEARSDGKSGLVAVLFIKG